MKTDVVTLNHSEAYHEAIHLSPRFSYAGKENNSIPLTSVSLSERKLPSTTLYAGERRERRERGGFSRNNTFMDQVSIIYYISILNQSHLSSLLHYYIAFSFLLLQFTKSLYPNEYKMTVARLFFFFLCVCEVRKLAWIQGSMSVCLALVTV